ncbi:MAG: phosphoenolpyruvate synthase [Bacteroidales bacterium]|nr:phosphoenolpyruvate synthase [Bacteroidales bacterium]
MRTSPLSLLSRKYYFDDTPFIKLMRKRIYHVLLIASNYDSFILESDGRIEEHIFNEYVSLNLRYPPQFIQVPSEDEAFSALARENIDLVICMLTLDELDTFGMAKKIKRIYPEIPIVVLTPFSREVSLKLNHEDLSVIDYVFSWLGNPDLLLAIIKLIEDKMNAEHDTSEVGVQVILLVEDSVRFYSSYLPNIYKIIFNQSNAFMTKGLNEHQQMLRRRGRPKILMATNYEEATALYDKYRHNLLGVISDISYKRAGKEDPEAGFKFLSHVRDKDEFVPFLLQSSDTHLKPKALEKGVGFLDKNSKTLSIELRNFMMEYFAFGDFVFIDPKTNKEIMRAPDLKALQQRIFEVPDFSLEYHIFRNHLSKWLYARALFPLAEFFKDVRPGDFPELEDIRRFIFDSIAGYRLNKGRGVIAQFNRENFDEYVSFTRIGEGSIGGKARGLAFLDSIIKKNRLFDSFPDVAISIPQTVVLCTDIFDEFMEDNDLYKIGLSDMGDAEILNYFVNARLPLRLHDELVAFIHVGNRPIAVRSSSLLEDSHYQPFAGVYSTYMVPQVPDDDRLMLELLSNAIKSVYASVFFHDSKAYMAATSNLIDEEKMAIVLQQVAGTQYGNRFYPSFSGVARSINFYPIAPEKPEDGIASIAIGLGKYIVDGGVSLRFSPRYPKKILQLSTPEMALRETQKQFYALDLTPDSFYTSVDDGINLVKLKIDAAEENQAFRNMVSTYDFNSQMLREGIITEGKRVATFANILNHNSFPLAEILANCLEMGQSEIGKPIEIEFAVELNRPAGLPKVFNLLQVRPIVDSKETVDAHLEDITYNETILYSHEALGNGIINGLKDIVYVKPCGFDPARNPETALRVAALNEKFSAEKQFYVLVGPGRWGSSDPWLGIPVKWPQISAARVIVESGLENYRIDPSQGTHFFQNLTSFKVGYFTIHPYINDGFFDVEFLNKFPAIYEDELVRHVRFDEEILVMINARNNLGVVMKPGSGEKVDNLD